LSQAKDMLEPAGGIEPLTYWLRMDYCQIL